MIDFIKSFDINRKLSTLKLVVAVVNDDPSPYVSKQTQ